MVNVGATKSFPDKGVVFRQGDAADVMYIVRRGKVRIYRTQDGKETTLSVLGPNEFFGEMALFDNKARSASAECVGETELQALTTAEFEELVSNDTVWGVLRKMSERIREASDAFEKLSLENMDRQDRLSSFSFRRDWYA